MDMTAYREYIDNEMMVTFAQMDKPSRIFDYLYLVSWDGARRVTVAPRWGLPAEGRWWRVVLIGMRSARTTFLNCAKRRRTKTVLLMFTSAVVACF